MAVVFALALSVRLLVPTGFMPVQASGGIVIALCAPLGSETMRLEIPVSDENRKPVQREQSQSCAFASLANPAIDPGGAVYVPRAPGLIHEIALPPPPAIRLTPTDYFVPPLRGPPALA
jgi:hypothetical protein